MRLAKGFILAVAGLFIVITLVSLLMPSKVMTVRTVVIHSTPELVFAKIADLKKWKEWHPVFMQDTTAMKISDPSYGQNAYAEWATSGKTNKLLVTEVFLNGMKASLMRPGENDVINIISVKALKDSNNVQAEWHVMTTLKWYPWEKFSGIFIDKITGPGYEEALNNLRQSIEGKP